MEMTAVQGNRTAYHGNHNNHGARPSSYSYSDQFQDDEDELSDFGHLDNGPHREMAIDVPANFIGVKKEPPRYPPVYQSATTGSAQSSQRSNPSKKGSLTRVPKPSSPSKANVKLKVTGSEDKAQLERIRKYEADLRKKREQEAAYQKEEDFLRTSLRGSKKLQELEESQAGATGLLNPNFVSDEENFQSSVAKQQAQQLQTELLGSDEILSKLRSLQNVLPAEHAQLQKVSEFFSHPRVQQTIDAHNHLVEASLQGRLNAPVHPNAEGIAEQVVTRAKLSGSPQAEELKLILQKHAVKGFLSCHDALVKAKKKEPRPDSVHEDSTSRDYLYERASQYGEENIKIVRINKTQEPLGATIKNEGSAVVVGRIVKGGPADMCGLLHEGDEILEINGIDVRLKTIDEVCEITSNLSGRLTFLVVPSQVYTPPLPTDKLIHFKALFDYDPTEDPYIPCHELGISFVRGDILHIIDRSDSNWWQAFRDGEESNLAGLIPSKTFQEQKETLMQATASDPRGSTRKCQCRCGPRLTQKKKRKQLYTASGDGVDGEEILTYEEVAQYYPQPNRKRPIVLIGPPNLGRQEIRQMLMTEGQERFMAAVPHTSRPPNGSERDGVDYKFISRSQFENDIAEHLFVEYGEFEKNLYGTSLESIRTVVNQGKTCILNLHPQSLRILRASDLKPFIVFIAPPNPEKLRQLKIKENHTFTDDECKKIIKAGQDIEANYGHFFDHIIMTYSLSQVYKELLAEINKLEVEPQWVPAKWVT